MVLRQAIGGLLFIVLGGLAIATMVNAPAILVGYGLIYVVEYYALLSFTPSRSTLYFLAAHLLALGILVYTKSVFTTVAVASILLRPPELYFLGRLKTRLGSIGLALSLAALEQFLALTVAILYYGDAGIHTGLAVYGVLLAPFTYSIYRFSRIEGDPLSLTASIIILLGYWLSTYAFPAIPLLLASIAGLIMLNINAVETSRGWIAISSILLVVIGAVVGGTPLAYNAKAALYPFNPASWTSDRWSQPPGNPCPATNNVFENTHDPLRLRIIETCVTVEGVVRPVPTIGDDGDYYFDIEVGDASLLGIGNMVLRKNGLHVEVVPADHYKVLQAISGGVCPGDKVRVTGVLVIDTDHGMWSEIHPAYKIEVLQKATDQVWPDCVRGKLYEGG